MTGKGHRERTDQGRLALVFVRQKQFRLVSLATERMEARPFIMIFQALHLSYLHV